jgi:acetyltransferase
VSNLHHLFNPRGIAVVGASPGADRAGGQTLIALKHYQYAGGVYPVNPRYPEILGFKCYASVADVPRPCDVAVIALPAKQAVEMVGECGKNGIRHAVILGGGFREAGPEGIELEAKLLATAREHDVRLIGPNCLGLVNVHANVYAAFGSISKPPTLKAGGCSAVLQSGGFGNSLVVRCGVAGIGFRYVVCSGNETDLTASELIDAFVDDPETKVILTYLEGIRDGRALIAACERALAAGKPVVAWKAGNTEQGQKAAASHTANMTGAWDIWHAAFRQCGVVEVQTIEEAIDFIEAHMLQPRKPQGRNACIMGGSGGSAVVFSDASDLYGLRLSPLGEPTKARLAELMPRAVSVDNPIDYAAGFLTVANAPLFEQVVDAVLADPAIDTLGVMFATAVAPQVLHGAKALANVQPRHGKPIYAFCSPPPEVCDGAFDALRAAGIPNYPSPNRVARVMALNAQWVEAQRALAVRNQAAITAPAVTLPAASGALNETQSKQLLASCGIGISRDITLAAAPIENAPDISFPVALKVVSRDIPHKTDAGGVKLNIANAADLKQASIEMLAAVRKHSPNAQLEGLLVSEMVTDGIETIVGVINDAVFGPVVAFGLGGTLAELMKDVTYRLAPFGEATARDMVAELRASKIFSGMRGALPRDVEAMARLLSAVSRLAWNQRERIAELDINPVLVRPAGKGVVAADALVVLQ